MRWTFPTTLSILTICVETSVEVTEGISEEMELDQWEFSDSDSEDEDSENENLAVNIGLDKIGLDEEED